MKDLDSVDTRFGFEWGNMAIERICHDKKLGRIIGIYTDREQMEIRITPGGRIRVYNHINDNGKEVPNA